ncbi:hypothetical protein AVEN_80651-1 [Araneus ventricosus]|uniref:Uncharacterized protein n=1 Tax=Araneus ventricosus TaxID=182803 RepID=A0A4Y2T2J9_ARAVE|nr:hypothetical protein AVEN_80651-1 [Araneus ventricosus]
MTFFRPSDVPAFTISNRTSPQRQPKMSRPTPILVSSTPGRRASMRHYIPLSLFIMFAYQSFRFLELLKMGLGDADLTKNVDATEKSSVCRLVHRDKIRYTSATWASEIDVRQPPVYGEHYLFQ